MERHHQEMVTCISIPIGRNSGSLRPVLQTIRRPRRGLAAVDSVNLYMYLADEVPPLTSNKPTVA